MKSGAKKLDEAESKLSTLLFNKPKDFGEKFKNENDIRTPDIDRKAAWSDDDDEAFSANIVPNKSGQDLYKNTLKRKYETLIGTPQWARLDKKIKAEDDDEEKILRTVGHLQKKKSVNLPKDFLELKKFPDLKSEKNWKTISCLEFHPTASVALVGGHSGNVSLYSVGGDVNNKLHSFKLQKYSLSVAHFTPDGSEAYIASNFKHDYCVYDLVKAEPKMVSLPRSVRYPKLFVMSPNGKILAVGDGFEEVFLISADSKELIRVLKHNSEIQSIVFGNDSNKLFSYCTHGEVYIWNLSTYRVEKKFYDSGCVTASCISTSPCGRLLATGTGEGIVNIYETANLTTSQPMPVKVVQNLKTKITNLKFNASSEILSLVSSVYPDSVKLVHIPSYHVFGNFPPQISMHNIECLSFSPNSGFMALGSNKGIAYLFRLKHYKNY